MKAATIKKYFEGQSILITGSTGTLGKILVEKILRCCPGVTGVYLLIREKKNVPIEERWKKITDLALFDVLKETNPKALEKVILVRGDLQADEMGISEDDKEFLLENITIIYHSAAMVQFTDSMTLAIKNNTKATYMLLNLARQMKKLQLFLYISTAFCNMNIPCDEAIEEVIPAKIDWRLILKLLETQPLILEALKEKLLFGQPNPYTWSKWLSEQIVNDYRIYFPTVITRPGSVITTIREPFPGWLDSITGLYALVQAVGFGLLRVVYSTWESYIDYVPADATVNAMLVASWKKHKEEAQDRTDVYNCCLAKDIPLKTKDFGKLGRSTLEKAPSKHVQWPSHIIVTTNEILYRILFVLFQLLPAVLVDFFNFMRNKKRSAMKQTIQLANVLRIFKKFSSKQLEFPNEKYKALNEVIPQEEWEVFNTVYEGLKKEDLLSLGYESVVKYCLKEKTDEESMIKNRRRYFWLVVIDETIIACIWIGGIFLLTKVIGSMM